MARWLAVVGLFAVLVLGATVETQTPITDMQLVPGLTITKDANGLVHLRHVSGNAILEAESQSVRRLERDTVQKRLTVELARGSYVATDATNTNRKQGSFARMVLTFTDNEGNMISFRYDE